MKKALLLIDIQNDYFPGGKCELDMPELALNTSKRLIEHFRAEHLPIFYVQHIAKSDASFFIPNTEGVQIHAEITPHENDIIIIKHYPNSFFKTNLNVQLQHHGVTDLVVCGMMSHMCIDTTVRYAKELGYNITLIADACTTKALEWNNQKIAAPTVHATFMAALNGRFATVITEKNYTDNF